jgi:ribose 5-phosphate isomerase RpiB
MKIAIASDHAGFALQQDIVQYQSRLGNEVLDLGALQRGTFGLSEFCGSSR